ncbi:hypothetical protein [Microbulbifer sp. 2205BS26-8]|uniref:hypothetical protein n=1 Tax=Microbulbifer sp. 2205BS26-8 TaxID=3064386 RepID=UPI00273ED077|nr:hypothetical protein [Microbulbifer sp. 2205BS26-8]MDP5210907.1 hypothetical protein [Microbulbifer sp. 2205BS26-8]
MKNHNLNIIITIFISIIIGTIAVNTRATEKTYEQIVEESNTVFSDRYPSIIDNQTELARLAHESPYTEHDATVFFKQPKKFASLLSWAQNNEVEVTRLEARIPVAEQVFTMVFMNFAHIEGSMSDKLQCIENQHDRDVSNMIRRDRQSVYGLINRDRAVLEKDLDSLQNLLKKPLEFMRVELLGSYSKLSSISQNPDTALLILLEDKSTQRVANSTMPKYPCTPGNRNSLTHSFGAVSEGDHEELGPDEQTITNPILDSFGIEKSSQMLSTHSTTLGESPSICGGPTAPEKNCPGDRYWLPYKDDTLWGVLIHVYGEPTPWMEGEFASIFEWSTIWDSQAQMKQNTMAFKAVNTEHCNPEIIGASAPCGGSTPQQDVTYVPESTYEHEGRIQNLTCRVPRTGLDSDREHNCLTPSRYISTLPYTYYLDTVVGDPSDTLSATIGTLSPEHVNEGIQYRTNVYFWSFGNEDFTLKEVVVAGQIGTEYPFPAPAPFRVFPVDTTKIDDGVLLPVPLQ